MKKSKNKRSIVGESTHCTSFGVCKRVPLVKIQFPADLCAVLNKNKNLKNVQLYNDYMKLINNLLVLSYVVKIYTCIKTSNQSERRKGILFIGGFKSISRYYGD